MTPEFWAAIGGIGTALGAIIYTFWRLRRIKTNDLHGIWTALRRIEGKIDGHIKDHAKGEFK